MRVYLWLIPGLKYFFCCLSSSLCTRAGLFPSTLFCTHRCLFSAWVHLTRWVPVDLIQILLWCWFAEWFTWIWVLAQDTSAENCLLWPELYMTGQRQKLFNPLILCVTIIYSIYTSIILFFLPFGVYQDSDLDYQILSVTVEMSAVFSVTIEVSLFPINV